MDTPLQVGLWACGVWETLDTPPSFVPCSVDRMSREGKRRWYAGVREMEAVTCSSYWRGGEEGVRRWEAIVVYSFMQYFWVGSLWKKAFHKWSAAGPERNSWLDGNGTLNNLATDTLWSTIIIMCAFWIYWMSECNANRHLLMQRFCRDVDIYGDVSLRSKCFSSYLAGSHVDQWLFAAMVDTARRLDLPWSGYHGPTRAGCPCFRPQGEGLSKRRNFVDPAVSKWCSDESIRTVMEICPRGLAKEPTLRQLDEDVLWNLQFAALV